MSTRLGLVMLASLALTGASASATTTQRCRAVADLLSPTLFHAYPAKTAGGPWRAPDVRFGRPHMYRTLLRRAGKGPPDLAGHYKIVRIGCGAGCVTPTFVDLATGRVTFERELGSVEFDDQIDDVPGIDDFRLVHRRDSRLLIVVGLRNENETLSGVATYDWGEEHPRLIRFVPRSELCRGKEAR